MWCALTAVYVGMLPFGIIYQTCEYRCPRDVSYFYNHYPYAIRVPYGYACPLYARVGDPA